MICWNCWEEIPDTATLCQYCEGMLNGEVADDKQIAYSILSEIVGADPDHEFRAEWESSNTAEEFLNRLFVGDCPRCHSRDTEDCENDPEIETNDVGRCLECGFYWCIFCVEEIDPARFFDHDCPEANDIDFDETLG